MFTNWQLADLLDLVRLRYPDWDSFSHPGFIADEIKPKQATIAKARDLISQAEISRLLQEWQYDELFSRLERLGRDNNLLFNRIPRQGDLAILYDARLDKAEFALQMQKLLHGSGPTPQRLQAFSQYALTHNLPNKWTFPTYFLFIVHPDAELFVKPQVARWLLKFIGQGGRYTTYPDGDVYATLRAQAHALLQQLQPYGPQDMVDIQSLLWICARESRSRTGRLNIRGQVELNIPPDIPATYLHESSDASYTTDDPTNQPSTQPPISNLQSPLPLESIAETTGFQISDLRRWTNAIQRKGQAIFYGPPGTGKTMLAQQLAQHLVGGGDGFVDLVQFHPAYQYEDFIQGLRPIPGPDGSINYEMVPGRFLDFCAQAAQRDGICVLIIDEINRANLSQVFGELMYLLEYRDRAIPLAGGGSFSIPANVRLIGTMNTADRSIALVDHALRRRFAFIALPPNYDLLRHYHARHDTGFPVEKLIAVLERLNRQIADPHYAVGVTFFLRPDLHDHLGDIWQMEIEPYLEEYFFDRPEQLAPFRWIAIRGEILPQMDADERG